ncbi:MAG TPA: hypothetical protein VGL39_24885 [Jatrophihabitantaceae bacterium]|jgi:hypothetical protein
MTPPSGLPTSWPGIEEIAWLPAPCVDEVAAVQAMHQTHHALMDMTGAARRSRVWWWRYRGRAECQWALAELSRRDLHRPADTAEALEALRGYVDRQPYGVLVVAACEVEPNGRTR